jgi:ABC-2 type transport system ATP-binding protein
MTNGEHTIEAQHISKSFGRRGVLKDVTFGIRQGEIVGIAGENGAGKTTLLKILIGLLAPTAGEVTIKGRAGYCPQEMLVFETLTVRENFRLFAAAYGLDQTKRAVPWEQARNELLERFRFSQYEKTLVSHLSGGAKQKLNLALALLHSPDVLILDEPYSGFDWETYLHFWEFASELRSQGRSVLIVSHFVYDRSKLDLFFELSDGVLRCV